MAYRKYDNCDTYKMIIPKKYRNHHHINKEKNIGTLYYITIKWHSRKGLGLNPQCFQQTWIFYKHYSGGPISYIIM